MRNFLQELKKFKEVSIIISALFLVLASALFVFLYQKIENDKKGTEQAQTEQKAEEERRASTSLLQSSLKDIGAEKDLLEAHFARNSDIVPFLDAIEKMATDVAAKPEITSVDTLKDKSGLSVSVKATGSFSSIYKFLLLLENSPYEIDFTSVDLKNIGSIATPGKTGESARPWQALFKIQLLSFIQ